MINAPRPPQSTSGLSPRELAKTFAQRARAAAEQSRIRSSDVMGPAIEAIATAPAIIVEVTEGAAREAATEIGAHAKAVAQQVAGAKDTLSDLAKERTKQVEAANTEMRANFGKIAVGMADILREETSKIITADRLRRSYLGFGLACVAALLLGGGAYWSGKHAGRSEARAEMVGEAADRLNDWRTASENSRVLLDIARSTSVPMQVFGSLSLQQQTDLIKLVQHANRTAIPNEDVPFPCVVAGPKHFMQFGNQWVDTCIVAVPPNTRISGGNFSYWLKDVLSRTTPRDAKGEMDLRYWAYPLLPPQ